MSTAAPSTWSEDILVSGVWRVNGSREVSSLNLSAPNCAASDWWSSSQHSVQSPPHHLLLTPGNTFWSHLLNPFSNYLLLKKGKGKVSMCHYILEIFSFSDSISTFHSEMASYDPCSQVHEYWDLSNIPIFNFRDKTKYSKLIKQILKFPRY